jgi:hypothetical protein
MLRFSFLVADVGPVMSGFGRRRNHAWDQCCQ